MSRAFTWRSDFVELSCDKALQPRYPEEQDDWNVKRDGPFHGTSPALGRDVALLLAAHRRQSEAKYVRPYLTRAAICFD